ncbi:C10 family peptidase [Fodinibius saliphilus]|uniref:C10 family peptidase n=1 Tax=Fodinibius saliphilus TaxID=1920650 RepID=UPI001109711C|nr:C10 family peptidase [Fodinibius saliphilus]
MNKSLFKRVFFPFLVLAFFISCQQKNINGPSNETENIQKADLANTSVSKTEAVAVAENFANNYSFQKGSLLSGEPTKKKKTHKTVDHVLTVSNEDSQKSIYLINYHDGGFAVVPADKRLSPIQAFSVSSSMPVTTNDTIPGGLAIWLQQKVNTVNKYRKSKQKISEDSEILWARVLDIKGKRRLPPDDGGCEEWTNRVDPLLSTTWGQGSGYNDSAPHMGCDYPTNGRAYSGCVATAMAQIINYHEYAPGYNYNWSAMPNSYGSDEVSLLMRDIGDEVSMDYGCDASGADDDDMAPGMRHFGYSSATQVGYEGTTNRYDVIDDLDDGDPVLFNGYEKDYVLGIFPTNGNGHAWVGDGYIQSKLCPTGNTYLNFHMNWGWNGSYDGWYAYNEFDPADSNYDRNSEVVINIHP